LSILVGMMNGTIVVVILSCLYKQIFQNSCQT
jgi:hypothetical protein